MNIALFSIFLVLSIASAVWYFVGKSRFSPAKLFLAVWLAAIALSQLRLSTNEQSWSWKFWLILLAFLAVFYGLYQLFAKFFDRKLQTREPMAINGPKIFFWLLMLMTVAAIAANAYIYLKLGTLPILSSQPDSFRFVINRKLFGAWEYAALFPRLAIPFSVFYLLFFKPSKWIKAALIANIVVGFAVLSVYAARLVLIFPILLSYFIYLIANVRSFNWKKLAKATVAVVVVVLVLSVAIPAFRQSITYRDYQDPKAQKDPFTYISKLSGLQVPPQLNFIVPIYIIPTFNLQAMSRAVDFYGPDNLYHGAYSLIAFNPALKLVGASQLDVKIPWNDLFLPWWVTATYLFSFWADFWYFGIAIGAAVIALLFAFFYKYATKKPNFFGIVIFAYLSFAAVMTIYTNYFQRPEVYLDLAVIVVMALVLEFYRRKSSAN